MHYAAYCRYGFTEIGGQMNQSHMTGLGGGAWDSVPLAWRAADVVYAILGMAVVIGLWRQRAWGVVAFLLAALSQIVLYGAFAGLFALSAADEKGLSVMIAFHVVALALFIWIWRARL